MTPDGVEHGKAETVEDVLAEMRTWVADEWAAKYNTGVYRGVNECADRIQAALERERAERRVDPPSLDTVAQAAMAGIDLARSQVILVDLAAVRRVAGEIETIAVSGQAHPLLDWAAELRRALGD